MRYAQSTTSKTSSSSRFSHKKVRVGRQPFHKKGDQVKSTDPVDERCAQLLQKLYTEFKRRHLGQPFRRQTEQKIYLKYFRTAAIKLRHLRTRGYPTSPTEFVWALFTFFGKGVYPVQFASDNVWKMFFKWKSRQGGVKKRSVKYDEELDTLEHLCRMRGETIEVVWPQVRATGMFSDEFVKRFENRGR